MTITPQNKKFPSKKHGNKNLLHMFFSVFLIFLCFFSSHALAKKAPVYAAIVIDANTGSVLHQESADVTTYPASLTKMMTLLMTFDALNRGQIRLNEQIPISNHAASMVPSKIGLPPGAKIKVEDAIYALVTKSANDISVALAERLGGSESNFALMMTNKAKKLGMTKTRFKNASGLHNPGQVTTARDMARLSLVLIHDYKLYYRYFSTKNFHYKGKSYHNHNRLLGVYPGMDGLKTGYIVPSGFNLAASAVRGNKRIVGVVMGGKTAQSRNKQMVKILDRAFAQMGAPILVANDNNRKPDSYAAKSIPVPAQKPIYISQTKDIYIPDEAIEKQEQQLAAAPTLAASPENTAETGKSSPSYLPLDGINAPPPSSSPPPDTTEINTSPAALEGRWAMLSDTSSGSLVNRMTNNGESNEAVQERIKTGLIAVAAITNTPILSPPKALESQNTPVLEAGSSIASASVQPAPELHPVAKTYLESGEDSDWSIQIGAYSTRDRTNKALGAGIAQLPQSLRYANAMISPLKTENGWVYRARLTGYTKQAANQACSILPECLVLSPNAKH